MVPISHLTARTAKFFRRFFGRKGRSKKASSLPVDKDAKVFGGDKKTERTLFCVQDMKKVNEALDNMKRRSVLV